jgi:thiamine-phosphate pyrophosphorylase
MRLGSNPSHGYGPRITATDYTDLVHETGCRVRVSAHGKRPRTTLSRPIVIMVSDRRREPDRLLERVSIAARAGVSIVQLRERELEDADLLALAKAVTSETGKTETRTVVNDRLDIALIAGADGVHLPGYAPGCRRVRRAAPTGFLIGRSVHSLQEARAVEAEGGCDYLVFGTVFPSVSKPAGHTIAGVSALAEVCAAVTLPVVAIGGITLARLPDVVRAGAAGIAAIDLFVTAREQQMIERLREIRLTFSAS